ncbi:MAG TPA: hypothetical protein VJL29_13665 [Thermoguttaceae bacterium]|nr:hypothetical protein [Thermoguttaceae bacterium]
MKSERRHELQHNELAEWMVNWGASVKPYANVLLGGVLAVVIVLAGWTMMTHKSSRDAARAWEDFYAALSARSFIELNNVVDHYPGTEPAQWAQVVLGDLRLAEGCDELFQSRAGASDELKKARKHYEDVLTESKIPAIRQRATFGLARTWESEAALNKNDALTKAIEQYKKLIELEGPYSAVAQARIAALEKPAARKFYDKFAKYDPKPAFREDTTPPLQFDNLDNLKMPAPGESLLPKLDVSSRAGESSETPDEEAKQPPAEPSLPGMPKDAKSDDAKQ